MNKIKMSTMQIKSLFEEEFGVLQHKFEIFNLSLTEAKNSKEINIAKAGVYVFWHPERGVIKVGRHFTNSRKRAFEHINDNTGGTMALLKDQEGERLLLFNLKGTKDKHWAAALEIFFEENLFPEIKSGRLG